MAAARARRPIQVRPCQRVSVCSKHIASRGSGRGDRDGNQDGDNRRNDSSSQHYFNLTTLRRQKRDKRAIRRHFWRARHLIPPLLARVRRRTRPARGHSPDPRRGRERARGMGDNEQSCRPCV